MNSSLVVKQDLDKARRDLRDATQAMSAYFGRGISDTDGQMNDVRAAVEGLTRAIASVMHAVERLAELPVCDGAV